MYLYVPKIQRITIAVWKLLYKASLISSSVQYHILYRQELIWIPLLLLQLCLRGTFAPIDLQDKQEGDSLQGFISITF